MRPGIATILLCLAAGCSQPPPAPKPDPATLRTPVPAAELRRIVPGHFIDERPYPCDAGPMIIHADGKFTWVSGWGDTAGTYRIADGAIIFDGYRSNTGGDPRVTFTVRFTRDGNGQLYYAGLLGDSERELTLGPIDRHTRWISCGNDKEPPPPPGEKAG